MERLIVEDEEARVLAQELAERRGTTVDEAVVASLRASLREDGRSQRGPAPAPFRIPTLEELTPEQRETYDRLNAIAQAAAPFVVPGATSDHRDMYDEHGLPK